MKLSSSIAISVIICNTIKIFTLFYIHFSIDIPTNITCTGEAKTSFISLEDDYTPQMSMASKRDFNRAGSYSGQLNKPPSRWAGAATNGRWITTIVTMVNDLCGTHRSLGRNRLLTRKPQKATVSLPLALEARIRCGESRTFGTIGHRRYCWETCAASKLSSSRKCNSGRGCLN